MQDTAAIARLLDQQPTERLAAGTRSCAHAPQLLRTVSAMPATLAALETSVVAGQYLRDSTAPESPASAASDSRKELQGGWGARGGAESEALRHGGSGSARPRSLAVRRPASPCRCCLPAPRQVGGGCVEHAGDAVRGDVEAAHAHAAPVGSRRLGARVVRHGGQLDCTKANAGQQGAGSSREGEGQQRQTRRSALYPFPATYCRARGKRAKPLPAHVWST